MPKKDERKEIPKKEREVKEPTTTRITKARFWWAVLYPENMLSDWEDKIGDIVQLPFCYCVHDKSKDTQSEHRKTHIHLILAFPNTTTYKHALSVFDLLSAADKKAVNTCEAVINIRNTYDYLIHDTDTCKKKGKELYPKTDRICGNTFDIGAYEQVGAKEKLDMCKELCDLILDNGLTNFADFYFLVMQLYEDSNYFECLKANSGFFERLTKANYQKWQVQQQSIRETDFVGDYGQTSEGLRPKKFVTEDGRQKPKKK